MHTLMKTATGAIGLIPRLLLPLLRADPNSERIGREQPIGTGRIVGRDNGGKRAIPRVARNKPCLCGSTLRFKRCCGKPKSPQITATGKTLTVTE